MWRQHDKTYCLFLGSVPCFPRIVSIPCDRIVPQPLLIAENLLKSFRGCLHVNPLAEIWSAAKARNKLIVFNGTPYHTAFCRLAANKTPVHSRILLSHPLWVREVHAPCVNAITELLSCVVIKSCFHNSLFFWLIASAFLRTFLGGRRSETENIAIVAHFMCVLQCLSS